MNNVLIRFIVFGLDSRKRCFHRANERLFYRCFARDPWQCRGKLLYL